VEVENDNRKEDQKVPDDEEPDPASARENHLRSKAIQERISRIEKDQVEPNIAELRGLRNYFVVPIPYFIDDEFSALKFEQAKNYFKMYQGIRTIMLTRDPELIQAVSDGIKRVATIAKTLNEKGSEHARLEAIEKDYKRIRSELAALKKESADTSHSKPAKRRAQ